ncbi:MAG: hypothetical protein OXU77_18940 [Gammaproteobacteria bacterium]|nr:hypothetical protein [Gammaproteobacteria bacterium]
MRKIVARPKRPRRIKSRVVERAEDEKPKEGEKKEEPPPGAFQTD